MPAAKTAKIVVLKEEVDVQGFAEESVRRASVFDGATLMATEAVPEEDTVQTSQELGVMVANLSASETKKMESDPNVEAVEDDITVYAMNEMDGDAEAAMLAVDDWDRDLIEGLDRPETGPGGFEVTAEEIQGVTSFAPDIDPARELALMEMSGEYDPEVEDAIAPIEAQGLPRDVIIRILKCVMKCALGESGKSGQAELSDDQIRSILEEISPSRIPGRSGRRSFAANELITRGLRQILAPQAWRLSRGQGVRVGVVDTGVAPGHPDLRVFGGASFVPGVTSWADDQGHGTHVAGTIAALDNRRGLVGVAPEAQLHAVKVLNRNGSGQLSWILNGLTWCRRNRIQVVNLSLGSRVQTHDQNTFSRAYERAGRALRRRGVVLCAAAGNTNEPVGNPARCPSFMAVSAVDFNRRKASFSCFGPQVEICAPGVGIESTFPPRAYRSLSGTSMATPHVAGVAALVKARNPGWHGDRIRAHLLRTARDLGRPGRDPFFGMGEVNALRAVL